MANITLKNIPGDLHEKLKERAKMNHRSINSEILFSLKKVLGYKEAAENEEVLEQAREFRKKINVSLSDVELNDAKRLKRE